jgi:thiosulfate dehydrogenase (quinone) large subunit
MGDGPDTAGGRAGRRDFLGVLALSAVGVAAAAGTAAAAVFAMGNALRREARGRACVPAAGRAAGPTLQTVEIRTVSGWAEHLERRGAYVESLPDGSLRAFSATCPHAGCFVDWKPEANEYLCPCHVSRWTRDGARISGPAKRGLDPLPVTPLPGGGSEVCFKSFVLDTADRIEVG